VAGAGRHRPHRAPRAIVLGLLFRLHGDGWGEAAWRGLFTAISAYCNAGFALQSDSLIPYQDSGLILHLVALLIILGGLGPVVVAALPRILAREQRPSLHARIVLLTTAVLLVIPTCLIGALEWNHSLAGLSVPARLHNAWFQSVTTRTAGFNSVDFAALTPATQTLVEALMFIGGSPGSTAGGIKTTTVFVLVFAVVAVVRLRPGVIWGGWRIPHTTIYRAAAVVTLGALSVVFGVFVIQLTQDIDTDMAIFEVVSALGTVGLSTGGTAQLDNVGKVIITVCMFMGRVAPLTVFLIFSRPGVGESAWKYPEQDISVG
jgi:trk system potassium uptake protein TrkH